MKKINDLDFKYWILFNNSTLQIVANILMSYVSFKYFDTYSIVANIFVSSFLISCSVVLLFNEKKKHRRPTLLLWNGIWGEKKSTNVLIWLALFCFFCLKSFVFIRYFSILDGLYQDIQIKHESTTFLKLIVLSGLLTGAIGVQIYFYYKKIISKNTNISIKKLIEKYQLDFKNTYFFTEEDRVLGFRTGKYTFRPEIGFFDGERWHSASVVLEYLNLSGIGFHDLDEGHVKNIEMYGISV